MKCSICNEDFGLWIKGNNAQPINDGRCCNNCNLTKVIPTRIKNLKSKKFIKDIEEIEEEKHKIEQMD